MNPALDSRARFEAHWRAVRGAKKAANELRRHPADPQVYINDSANRHFVTWQEAWQAAIASMAGWLPIETAPEVGNFLVYLPKERDGKRVLPMIRRKNLTTIGDRFAFDCSKPTHWQPLPAPPTPQDPPIAALAAKETT